MSAYEHGVGGFEQPGSRPEHCSHVCYGFAELLPCPSSYVLAIACAGL